METNREGFAAEYQKSEKLVLIEKLQASKAYLENLPGEIESVMTQDTEQ